MSRPKGIKRIKKSIRKQDLLRLIAFLDQKKADILKIKNKSVKLQLQKIHNSKIAFYILFHTGLRVSELVDIKMEHIKEAILDREFSVFQSKQSRARSVSISVEAAQIFREIFNEQLNEMSLNSYAIRKHGKSNSKLSENYMQEFLNKTMKEVLGDRYTTHSFRKGLINDLLKNGYHASEVQEIVGHADVRTTLLYANRTDIDRRKEMMNSERS